MSSAETKVGVEGTRVLLAEDHALVRVGLRSLLESAKVEVIAEANDGNEAVERALALKPEIAFLDISMPKLSGIDAAREIHERAPEIGVVIVSMHANRHYILESTRAGARGYVLKDSGFEELIEAIEHVKRGEIYLCREAAKVALDAYVRQATGDEPAPDLNAISVREREVLQLIAAGKSSPEIAEVLHISPRTVDTHRQNLMQKLGVRSIAGLTRLAIRMGLCPLD